MVCELHLNKNDFLRIEKKFRKIKQKMRKGNKEQKAQTEKNTKMTDLTIIHNHIKHIIQTPSIKRQRQSDWVKKKKNKNKNTVSGATSLNEQKMI